MRFNIYKYSLRRLLGIIPVFLIIVTASFFLMRLAPGGPFDSERVFPPEVQRNVDEYYGLKDPVLVQYLSYMTGIFKGTLGYSFTYPDKTVGEIIVRSLGISFVLGITAFFIALLFGTALGVASALRKNRLAGLLDSFFVLGVSIPNIVLCPVAVFVFGIWLSVLPVAGWGSFSNLILPSLTLSVVYAAFIARITKASLSEVLEKDYVKAARAMGVKEGKVVLKYALRGSLLPVISYLAPAFAGIITGSLVIERIFFIPGLGQHFVQAALNRDYPLALGTVIFYSTVLLLLNLLADIIYALVDPRISYE